MRRGGLFFLLLLEVGVANLAGVMAAALADIVSVAGGQPDDPSLALPSFTPAVQAMQRHAFVFTVTVCGGAFVLVHLLILVVQKLTRHPANADRPPRPFREGVLTLVLAATFATGLSSAVLELVVARGGPLPAAPVLLGWLTTIAAFFALCFAWKGHAGWRRRALIATGLVVASSSSLTFAQASLAPALVTSLAAFLHLAFDEIVELCRARLPAERP